ncbi:hypothetical protein SIL81_07425 [Xanthomonas campestris pv. incanae]|uniref:hypothetical protein n=1 Tax=Xanthomonas TaxID=338 RepID=UPI000A7D319E|nr:MULTISPECIES: hypothetical protein [Xanthomonas]MDX6081140.1 hypothetical protein [Xanthomonas campestris pv. incanae]MDX6085818.1 hypothetical protein [Xanthomonas campestris pv. incanae]MDX6139027.1 hypothetical protein [Xanthomonas campestris pv. incanae]
MSMRSQTYVDSVVGIDSHLEVSFLFAAWAVSRRSFPTNAEVRNRWGMSRSTAWRYLRALRNTGLHPGATP